MNPFPVSDGDRHAIWTMLVERDIQAFLAVDWNLVEDDFMREEFHGIDARMRANPDSWRLAYPTLEDYRAEWLRQAEDFKLNQAEDDPACAIHALTTLRDIEINGNRAIAHKRFDGILQMRHGPRALVWQTLYHCRKNCGTWKITGFTGYLPNPMGGTMELARRRPKCLPDGASQHLTAGPYSPVLEVSPGKLIVISGQAALNAQGQVVGDSIEEQTSVTLENCFAQLKSAGCAPTDIFKVNIYMTDLNEWSRLNRIYEKMMPVPRPVRTAVQTKLLFTLKVEIEMWAVRP